MINKGIFSIKSAGAEDVGGCAQFKNTYSITKVLKKDGITAIDRETWKSFITIDADSSLLKVHEYSGASITDFDEA